MKKSKITALLLTAVMSLSLLSFTACKKTFTVTFDSAGGGNG